MRNRVFLVILSFLPLSLFGQHGFAYWFEAGVKGELIGDLDWAMDLNARFDSDGLQTFFPQPGLSYKVTKWFKPSVEYRLIVDKNKVGNYKSSSRININGVFDKSIDRLRLTARLRYQFVPQINASNVSYNPDFDQAFRFKPKVKYDINNFKLSPEVSAEFFYNPVYGPEGRQFSKIRYAGGFSLDTNGPNNIALLYRLDHTLHDPGADLEHIISLSYSFEF